MGFMEKDSIYESIKYVIPDPFEGERYELVKIFYPMDIFDGWGWRFFSECGKNIVIKGDAGSGKTTLLKRLCIFFMHKEENAYEDEILKEKYGLTPEYTPLFIKLRRLKKYGYSFDALLKDSCEIRSMPGKIILLLDGMDEIPDERREGFLRELYGFQRKYDDMRIVISGRFVGFEGAGVKAKLSEMGFDEMKIRPLTDDQIYEYGCRRLNLMAENEQSYAVLKNLINGGASDFLRKPLSLEIILRRISEGEDVTFTDRNGIFREMITGLIGGRESGEARECLCRDSLNILGLLAFFVVDSDGMWADDGILKKMIDAIRDMTFCSDKMKPGNMEELKAFLDGVAQNTGLLEEPVEAGGDVYGFPIRAYMEYLCAYACCNLSFRGKNGLDPLPV